MATDKTDETKPKPGGCAVMLIGIFSFVAILSVWIFSSAMEARAYERVTGKKVSTWDAMWIELRVQEGARE